MKRSLAYWGRGMGLVVILAFLGAFSTDPGKQNKDETEPKIHWVTVSELQELNEKEPRKVFIDIYATWCGPCKLMDKKTFADPKIIKYVNDNYYAVKLNGEGKKQVSLFGKTMTEAELAYAFRIQGYPSIVFMDEKLQPYQPVAGYIPAQNFIKMLKQFNDES
ncbi:MAG: thioredoxin fold domain-containing protein [Cyclobacteriaceae bacterium]|nr:thioredoxin fold domain-containing protein [Cyclobacteriaceae bacterium]